MKSLIHHSGDVSSSDSKHKTFRKILLVLILITLALIWGQSAMSRQDSEAESAWVMELIMPFLEIFVGRGRVTLHLVRKLAHFTEYALLGAELTLYSVFGMKDAASPLIGKTSVFLPLIIGLAAAAADETIQIFSGRGPAVADVLLDFCGVLTAFIFIKLVERYFS